MPWAKATDPNKPVKQQQYDMAALRKKAMLFLKKHMVKFVENFVNIESKEDGGSIVPFKLWPEQKRALKSIAGNRLNVILKARQLGITWLVLAYAVYKMLFWVGFSVIALSKTEEDAKELIRRMGIILEYMPEIIQPQGKEPAGWTGLTYKLNALYITIFRQDGLESTFKAFPSSPSAGRSHTANLLLLDEWGFQEFARRIWTAVYPTINRPTGGQVIGLSTIERGTLFEEIFVSDNNFNKIFLSWSADPNRDMAWYEQTAKDLGGDVMAEYPSTVEEALTIPGGAYFPEVKSFIHIKKPLDYIPDYFRRYVCLDYGLDMLAAHWIWIDEEGYRRVYRELDASDLTISAACAAIREANSGDKIDLYLAPVDLWNRSQESGRSRADIFSENGIALTRSSNNRENGCAALKEDLLPIEAKNAETGEIYKTAKLTIDADAAPNLWRCLNKIQKDAKKTNIYADMPHELTHDVDSLRYFSVYWTIEAQKPKEEFKLWHMPERKRRSY